jgi:polyisoprenoid-binding protein YceI
MKTIIHSILLTVFIVAVTSCKNDVKKKEKESSNTGYTIDTNRTAINWTAYKTTDKVAVAGKFTFFNITNNHSGNTISEALDGAEFSIPVTSVFSNNSSRDYKIKNVFFGVMKNTELISGKIQLNDATSGLVMLTMNDTTKELPFSYVLSDQHIEMSTVMKISDWALPALESIHKACELLHTGPDGISKTWDEAAIDIDVYFKK